MGETPPPARGSVEHVPAGGDEDLLAADRRTMIVAIVAVVALVLVGITSAALFSPSPCRVIAPSAATPGAASGDVGAVVSEALSGLDGAGEAAVLQGLADAAVELGPVVGAGDVRGATGLTWAVDGPAALGPVTTVFDAGGATARAAADTGGSTVVGSGPTLYALALTNLLTGQVDALQPLDAQLDGLTCQDTATVATPLAFHLDAGDGQLLVLRIDEDGDDPDLELRDEVEGRVWAARFDAGAGPAGTVAARLDAVLGDDLVVAARRSTPDDEGAIVTAVARVGGDERWTATRDEVLPEELRGATVALTVVAVDGRQVLLAAAAEREGDTGPEQDAPVLVALDPGSGAPLGTPTELDGPIVDASAASEGVVAVAWPTDAGWDVALVGDGEVTVTGEVTVSGEGSGQVASLAATEAGVVVLTSGTSVAVLRREADALRGVTVDLGIEVVDVVAQGERTALLLRDSDGGAVVVTFDG